MTPSPILPSRSGKVRRIARHMLLPAWLLLVAGTIVVCAREGVWWYGPDIAQVHVGATALQLVTCDETIAVGVVRFMPQTDVESRDRYTGAYAPLEWSYQMTVPGFGFCVGRPLHWGGMQALFSNRPPEAYLTAAKCPKRFLLAVSIAPGMLFAIRPWRRRYRRRNNLCLQCGYSKVGNTTGRCPECGVAFGGGE